MEYHYSDLCLPNDHLLTDYNSEFSSQYMIPNHANDAEYTIRSSVLVDGGDRFGVSSVVFDKFEELIWMGNQGGHVTSYYGPNMQKYTSFQIHENEEVRDILTLEQGIYCLTKSTLRHQIRRGIPKHTFRSENMIDMQCLFQVSSTKLYMGGHQDKLLELDLEKMVETVIPIQEEGCAVLRSGGGSTVACGSATGIVALRDIRSPNVAEQTFTAHSACLSDLDMQGDLLITCGFTQSVNGVAVAEQYIIVWDVRYIRNSESNAFSVPTMSPPLLLHFLPAFSGRVVAMSGDGHVAFLNVNAETHDQSTTSVLQVDTQNSQCSVMDISATSQALVFGDQSGHLHLFSAKHNQEPVFNNFSRDTEFADRVEGLPFVSLNETTFQHGSVQLPNLAAGPRWFNELPPDFYKKVYRKPKPLDAEVLKTMKMQGPIGYAPNPRTFKRNQMPYIENTFQEMNGIINGDHFYDIQPIPKQYLKLDLRYNKHNPSEEITEYNKTSLPGLEATVPNSYCNPMLQVLYYTAPVKATLLAHTCAKEFCLSCELGFLFRMLDTSGGTPCHANNFLRAFRTVPEAAALGLIIPDLVPESRMDLIGLIQSWNRFILHQIHYEILETRKKEKELAMFSQNAGSPPKHRAGNAVRSLATMQNNHHGYNEEFKFTELEFIVPAVEFEKDSESNKNSETWRPNHINHQTSPVSVKTANRDSLELPNNHQGDKEETEISQLFAIGRNQINRCLKCNKEEERESVVLACALQYPSSREAPLGGGFIELMRASLAARRSTPAWCEQCARFTPATLTGNILRLPPILAINCGGVTAHEKAYWAKGLQKEIMESVKRAGSGKPCRYGLHCARPGCRFKHPDRPMTKNSTQPSQCILPLRLAIRLQPDGDVSITDKSDPSEHSTPSPKHKKKQIQEEEYVLTAAVVCVEDNPKNLVAYIQTEGKDDSHWYLFNDLCIAPVSTEEVVHFSSWWKSPCVLFYSSSKADMIVKPEVRS